MTFYEDTNLKSKMSEWEYLWTTDAKDYFLIKMGNDDLDGYTIGYIPTDGLLTIEDDDIFRLVIKNMILSGISVISLEQYIEDHQHKT